MGVFDLKFADYFLPVAADGVDAEVQSVGYIGTFHAVVNQRKYLAFTRTENGFVSRCCQILRYSGNGIDGMALADEIKWESSVNANGISDIVGVFIKDIEHSVQNIVEMTVGKPETQFREEIIVCFAMLGKMSEKVEEP